LRSGQTAADYALQKATGKRADPLAGN